MTPLHVLIIDSSIPHRQIMMRAMQDALNHLADGGSVEIVSHASEVEQKLQVFHPHAIIINFAMSIARVNGERIFSWLTRTTGLPLITYGLSEVLRPTAISAGAEAFFLRPTADNDWPPFCSKVVRFLHRLVFQSGSVAADDESPATTHAQNPSPHPAPAAPTLSPLASHHAATAPALPPLSPKGSAFRQAVWKLLLEIPYGETTTYGELARRLRESGVSAAPQAVGGAVGHNPISILIPCHRVLGADGSLTGYAGGVEKKRFLLELEGVSI